MDFRSILFIICIFIPAALLSQDKNVKPVGKDYHAFQETLTDEINKAENDPDQATKNILHPAVLPEFFLQFPLSDQNTLYAMGISDPGMEQAEAFQLAELRAKSLLSMLCNSELKVLADHFIDERSSSDESDFATKYSNLYQVGASMMIDTSRFHIEESHFTSFGEAIVLANYSLNGPGTARIKTIANVFQVERQKQNVFETEEKYEVQSSLTGQGEKSGYSYNIHSYNNLFEITSHFNDHPLSFPYYNFRYTMGDNPSAENLQVNFSSKLNYGLWKSFIEVFLQELYFLSQNPDIYISQVGNNYAGETKNLSRETLHLLHSVKIEKIQVVNNRIFLQLGILK